MAKYLDKAGLQVLWTKTKEIVKAADDKAVANATNIAANTADIATINNTKLPELQAAIEAVEAQIEGVTGGGVVTGIKGDAETEYRKGDVNITAANIGLGNVLNVASYSKEEVDALLDAKASADFVYNKVTVDELLAAKANAADVYSKTEADALLNAKANAADVETKEDAAAKLTEAKKYTDDSIAALLGEDVSEAYDTFKEIQTYIEEHGTEAQGMVTSINQNTADIEALNTKVDDIQALTADEINAILAGAPALITFNINSATYQAEEGMTWEQWVNSEYNVHPANHYAGMSPAYSIAGDRLAHNPTEANLSYSADDTRKITVSEVIIGGHTYYFEP